MGDSLYWSDSKQRKKLVLFFPLKEKSLLVRGLAGIKPRRTVGKPRY